MPTTELSELIHHFSWSTRISLELPLAFEEVSEDPEGHLAIYADDLDEDDPPGARVAAKLSSLGTDDPAALRRLADETAKHHRDAVREGPEEHTIDHLPALQQVLRYHEPQADGEVVRHETFVQAGNAVFSITGFARAADAPRYLPVFDHAARTARIILV